MSIGKLQALVCDHEELSAALKAGADEICLKKTGKCFSEEEIEREIAGIHQAKAKAVVQMERFAHNADLKEAERNLITLESLGADGVILADPGVVSLAKEKTKNLQIQISAWMNNTNELTAQFWADYGASRIYLTQELSIPEMQNIAEHMEGKLELGCLLWGPRCLSRSGRRLLKSYLGDQAEGLRRKMLAEETRRGEYMPVYEDETGTYIFAEKETDRLSELFALVQAGISCFQVEGRGAAQVESRIRRCREMLSLSEK